MYACVRVRYRKKRSELPSPANQRRTDHQTSGLAHCSVPVSASAAPPPPPPPPKAAVAPQSSALAGASCACLAEGAGAGLSRQPAAAGGWAASKFASWTGSWRTAATAHAARKVACLLSLVLRRGCPARPPPLQLGLGLPALASEGRSRAPSSLAAAKARRATQRLKPTADPCISPSSSSSLPSLARPRRARSHRAGGRCTQQRWP